MSKDDCSSHYHTNPLSRPKYLCFKWKFDINEPCIKKMLGATHSDKIKFNYLYGLQRYFQYRHRDNITKVSELLKGNTDELEDNIINYIQHMKDIEQAPTTSIRSARLAPLCKFYRNNCVSLNWDFVFEQIGKPTKKSTDVVYAREQIKKMLNGAS